MTDKQVVLTTCCSAEEARRIAQELVASRLAACVNIVPGIESVYRWEGEVESSAEWLLVIKTTTHAFAALRDAIGKMHSYDVPECLAIAVDEGGAGYLEWIGEAVG